MHMPAFRRQWTVDDLEDLPDDGQRYEVIDGELFVTPASSYTHQRALGVLYRLIADYLDGERVGFVFFAPADVTFSPKRSVQPDLFVIPGVDGRPPKSFADVKRLLLAVEVLSPSTGRADRVVKRALYRDRRRRRVLDRRPGLSNVRTFDSGGFAHRRTRRAGGVDA